MTLNPVLIEAKNLLHSKYPWIMLADINIANGGGHIRIACNTMKEVIWNSYTWNPLPVEMGTIRQNKEEIPQLEVRVNNISRIPESYAHTYEGFIASEITFYEVNDLDLSQTTNIPEFNIDIVGSLFDPVWAHFTLGINPNPYNVKDPNEIMTKNFCRFGYPNSVDPRCPYTGGVYTTCNRTYADCVIRLPNSIDNRRFGSFPAMGTNTIYA